MVALYYEGGTLFMGMLTLILLVVLVLATVRLIQCLKWSEDPSINIDIIKSVGLFALVVGVLGQFIGLYGAFESIEKVGEVSQGILFSGLKISSVTTIYGMVIFVLSYLLWFALGALKTKQNTN